MLTLDADSVLLPEYCLRLVHLLEQQRAPSRSPSRRRRTARSPARRPAWSGSPGATTDLQHIVHQGLTYYDATFWVGANAVIRKRALDDIVETSYVGDWEIRRYIKDRTVIEDTESTIDLGIHGWRLLQLPGAAELQRDAAGLRLAVHPAPALGQRRPADPRPSCTARTARDAAGASGPRFGETVPALELHGLDLLALGSACSCCWPSRSTPR